MQARQEMMQQRQAAWFDRLELTAEQRQTFQKEMQEHYQQMQKIAQSIMISCVPY